MQTADVEAVIDLGLYREEKEEGLREWRRKRMVGKIKVNGYCPYCFEIIGPDEAERHVRRHVEAGDEL